MRPISELFPNPAVKILEARLWEKIRKRYLGEHPADAKDDRRTVVQKVKNAYKDTVGAAVEEADQKIRATWSEFKHIMTEQLKGALDTVLHMSSLEWYSVEAGQLPNPEVIAVPYELLKHVTEDLMAQSLRKRIDFESFDDATLGALASYAVKKEFHRVLEEAHRNYEPFRVGSAANQYVVAVINHRDAYFLGEEQHHSLIDMVLLASAGADSVHEEKDNRRATFKKWLDEELKNRKEDRRFTGDGWEIEPEELKSWAA
jgi:hypothetical protein